ncbi:hypothetical protein AG1IA_04061 [Rhizoctonia solani AG-1 IA]|uniref:Uncharacterized protein n=2 Tax=Rhizoctonia solani TaxID=456999 RepID=A0A8H7LK46_9AGAM|nr:hypothetical protein AG1IA_04061 [Rhizoctonia solani AG-1 IA]KAF8679589.1 hypothetical protein RHS04_04468 [Rhizoctonia solani]CAE6476469.1 unnamed protein product [Rhizoctonia solani]
MKIITCTLALSLVTLALGQQASSQAPSSSQQQQSSAAPGSSAASPAPTTQAPSVTVITSFQQSVSLSGTSRVQVTVSVPVVITSTIAPAQPTGSSGGNGGNATQPAGNATSTSTTPTTYPTAASTAGPNGQGGQVAPSPGGSNPALGPDDNYISGAKKLVAGGVTILLGLGLGVAAQLM